jgi:predicted aspartyl protease
MARPIRRWLVALLTGILAPPVGAEDAPAAKPATPADARRATLVRAGYAHVPLALDPRRLSFSADCAVGPEKAKFFLDSGSMNSFLDLKLAKRLKLKLGEEAASVGVDGKLTGRRTYVPGLTIGSYATRTDWPSLPAQAADLSLWAEAPGGVLGVQVLDLWAAVVDYPARAMYLRPPLATAWPRLAGTWAVTSWQEDGAARKLDPKAPPTFAVADRRLKLTDGGKIREFAIRFAPNDAGDVLLLIDPEDEGKPDLEFAGGGLVKMKDGAMTVCLLLDSDKPRAFPTEFAAPKGSGYKLLELKHTAPDARKPPADPLRELLLKDGYTAVPLNRDLYGTRMAAARIGRHDLRLMVDTGASFSMFDTAGLDKWGAVRLGERDAHAWRGKVKGEDVKLRGLRVGEYDTRRAWAVVYGGGFDLAGVNEFFVEQKRKPIQGLLGNLDLLNGSAVIDFGTDTLYLRPVKETVGPRLEGKWVGMSWEFDGKRGAYKPGEAAVEFKGGRIRITTPGGGTTEWGFHLEDEGDQYRLGWFDPKADESADGFTTYPGGGLFKLTEDTLTMVTAGARVVQEPTEVAAPKGSGLLLIEYKRAK